MNANTVIQLCLYQWLQTFVSLSAPMFLYCFSSWHYILKMSLLRAVKGLIFLVMPSTFSVIYSEKYLSIWTNFDHVFEVLQSLFSLSLYGEKMRLELCCSLSKLLKCEIADFEHRTLTSLLCNLLYCKSNSNGAQERYPEFEVERYPIRRGVLQNVKLCFEHCHWRALGCDVTVQFVIFESMKISVELNSLLLKFFCYAIWFKERRNWRPCKRALFFKSYSFFGIVA